MKIAVLRVVATPAEFALHRFARLRVERRKRLVEQQHSGSTASARARFTRCCIPPESSEGYGMFEAAQADEVDQLRHPAVALGAAPVCSAVPGRSRYSRGRCATASSDGD